MDTMEWSVTAWLRWPNGDEFDSPFDGYFEGTADEATQFAKQFGRQEARRLGAKLLDAWAYGDSVCSDE